ALFGWSYFALSEIPVIESRLITTKALTYLDHKLSGRPLALSVTLALTGSGARNNQVQAVAFSPGWKRGGPKYQGPVRLCDVTTGNILGGWSGTTENFVRIGHSFLALMLGWLGGLFSRRLWRTSQ